MAFETSRAPEQLSPKPTDTAREYADVLKQADRLLPIHESERLREQLSALSPESLATVLPEIKTHLNGLYFDNQKTDRKRFDACASVFDQRVSENGPDLSLT